MCAILCTLYALCTSTALDKRTINQTHAKSPNFQGSEYSFTNQLKQQLHGCYVSIPSTSLVRRLSLFIPSRPHKLLLIYGCLCIAICLHTKTTCTAKSLQFWISISRTAHSAIYHAHFASHHPANPQHCHLKHISSILGCMEPLMWWTLWERCTGTHSTVLLFYYFKLMLQ